MKSSYIGNQSNEKATTLSYLTGLYIFFFYIEAAKRWQIFETLKVHLLFGLLLTILCFFKLLKRTNFPIDKSSDNLTKGLINVVFLFLSVLAIYSVASYDRSISMEVYSDRVIKLALIAFFITISVDKTKDLKIIVIFLLLAWFKIGSEGFLGWVTGSQMWQNQGVQRLHGSNMIGHPNSLSAFGVGALAFSAYLFRSAQGLLEKSFLSLLVTFSIVIIIFTGSRSGYVACIVVALYLFFSMKKNKFKIMMVTVVILGAASSFIPEEYTDRLTSIYTGKEAEGNSSDKRIEIMEDAWEIYKKYPMGVGIQVFSSVRIDMFNRAQNVHMLYLEVLTNLGPVGLIVFLIFIKRLLAVNKWNVLHSVYDDKESLFLHNLSKALIAFLLLRLIFGLFAMDLYEPHWWLALGLTLAVNKLVNLRLKEEYRK
ncbi:MAG: putative inorganic carbon (HCO3(-)) transporter [bacterium]|jgi:putative inorganic carbon (HCO3(-)) transporter